MERKNHLGEMRYSIQLERLVTEKVELAKFQLEICWVCFKEVKTMTVINCLPTVKTKKLRSTYRHQSFSDAGQYSRS